MLETTVYVVACIQNQLLPTSMQGTLSSLSQGDLLKFSGVAGGILSLFVAQGLSILRMPGNVRIQDISNPRILRRVAVIGLLFWFSIIAVLLASIRALETRLPFLMNISFLTCLLASIGAVLLFFSVLFQIIKELAIEFITKYARNKK